MFNSRKHDRARFGEESSGRFATPGGITACSPELLERWRRSEQRVREVWSEWRSAPAQTREALFEAYLRALDDEEHAAGAVEQSVLPRVLCGPIA